MPQKLRTAVIPAAGLGTRMATLTKGASKEMLPVAGRPIIDLIVDEAIAAGVERLCIVIRTGKEDIRDHFESQPHATRCQIAFAYQERPAGLGDALLCARHFVGDEPFAMLVPDQLFIGDIAPIAQLTSKGLPSNAVVSSLISVPLAELQYFPGARGFAERPMAERSDIVVITDIEPADGVPRNTGASTVTCGFGRTIYPPEVFRFLGQEFAEPQTGEVDLFLTFKALLQTAPCFGVMLKGKAYDLGTVAGYRRSGAALALQSKS